MIRLCNNKKREVCKLLLVWYPYGLLGNRVRKLFKRGPAVERAGINNTVIINIQ